MVSFEKAFLMAMSSTTSRAANIVNSLLVFVLLPSPPVLPFAFFLLLGPKNFTFLLSSSPVARKDLLFVLGESFAHDLLIPSKDDISDLARDARLE